VNAELCTVSSHVLDAVEGRPAVGVGLTLLRRNDEGFFTTVHADRTDEDGRVAGWQTAAGLHRLRFDTGEWFAARGVEAFYPEVEIAFRVDAGHYHVPLLLSPFAYSTYRGS
jgi:5-hydroxyisourate hydrolase